MAIFIAINMLVVFLVLKLLKFHLYLYMNKLTTYEYLIKTNKIEKKVTYKVKKNPKIYFLEKSGAQDSWDSLDQKKKESE